MAGEFDLFSIEKGLTPSQKETLARVVSSTFEKMGFMVAKSTNVESAPAQTITAVMGILTPIQGRIFFSAPQHLGWTIAENFYGLEDLTMEAVGDMMKELLNTITGSLLSTLMPHQQFTLSIPHLCDTIPADLDRSYVYHFNIDNKGIITIVLARNAS